MKTRCATYLYVLCLVGSVASGAGSLQDPDLAQIHNSLARGRFQEAMPAIERMIKKQPNNPEIYLMRGVAHEGLLKHKEAIADFDKTISLGAKTGPEVAEAYNRRGSEHFRLGHVNESIRDFDEYIKLQPNEAAGHWKRGISLYYAGRYEDGRKQFQGYERVDRNDVENSVWCYLCAVRAVGAEKARSALLKIGRDRRVPMMEVYALFEGKLKPEEVLAAANAGQPPAAELRQRLFYAHLYLGLYYESKGDSKLTREHIAKAAKDYAMSHYMGAVAQVHLQLLDSPAKPK